MNESIGLAFNDVCLSVEMYLDSRRCHCDVERLFLSFQLSKIVMVTSIGLPYLSCSSTDDRSPGRHTDGETGMCLCDV